MQLCRTSPFLSLLYGVPDGCKKGSVKTMSFFALPLSPCLFVEWADPPTPSLPTLHFRNRRQALKSLQMLDRSVHPICRVFVHQPGLLCIPSDPPTELLKTNREHEIRLRAGCAALVKESGVDDEEVVERGEKAVDVVEGSVKLQWIISRRAVHSLREDHVRQQVEGL
jgi:hypothetical protein